MLFLCTGNYYRSRFAEILFAHWSATHRLGWTAWSQGLALERGRNVGPIAPSAIDGLRRLHVPIGASGERFPEAVSDDALRAADRIVAVSRNEHLPLIRERHPAWVERIELWDVADDALALGRIEQAIRTLVIALAPDGARARAWLGPSHASPLRCRIDGSAIPTIGELVGSPALTVTWCPWCELGFVQSRNSAGTWRDLVTIRADYESGEYRPAEPMHAGPAEARLDAAAWKRLGAEVPFPPPPPR